MPDLRDVLVTAIDRIGADLDISELLRPRITGIEATQAIQYFKAAQHLTDTGDRGSDNTVTLAAYKPLVVRVYVGGSGESVTGTLTLERRTFGRKLFTYSTVGTYSPWGGSTVVAQPAAYTTERRSLGRTLNFRVPAYDVVGSMRLTATLSTGASRSVEVDARLVQTLRVRYIPITYNGPSTSTPSPPGSPPPPTLSLAAPTLTQMQTTAAAAFAMMPVQQTGSFAVGGSMNWFVPLDDPRTGAGACSNNWDSLLAWLGLVRDADGNRNDVVYYGLLPSGMPLGVPGCGVDGLGAGAVNDTATFVHEIGHGYGFQHTPSGNAGSTDPSYPTYEPYPSASIGEYGLDIRNGAIFSPATSTDYMSYGPARWMSLYQHDRLLQHPRLAPTWVKERNPFLDVPALYDPFDLWWPEPPWTQEDLVDRVGQPLVSVRGFVDATGGVRVDSVARIVGSPELHGRATSWSVELVGRDGEVAAGGRMARVETHGGHDCGCGHGPRAVDPDRPPFAFHALLPDVEAGSALRVVSPQGEHLWERRAPAEPVTVTEADAALRRRDLTLRWALSGDADVWAQWSADEGRTWHALAVNLIDGRAEVPVTGLPAGRVQVRLVAHDGFHSTPSDLLAVEVPDAPPSPAVLYPPDGGTIPADVPLEAWGSAVDQAGNPVEDERLEWVLDGDPVGRGRTATAEVRPGRHRLALRVADTDAEHEVAFEVLDADAEEG